MEISETKQNMIGSHPKYPEDYQFAELLLTGNNGAWNRFYNEFRKRLGIYINKKYPGIFSDITVEEICDGVGKRLIEYDYKVLKSYRGDCTFSAYITKATDWEVKDWLRKHSEELFTEPLNTANYKTSSCKEKESNHFYAYQENEENIHGAVKSLNDDLRWAFLLRYYDYFGFPLEEIRLLAKKKGVPISSITKKIIKFLEPEGGDILSVQREKKKVFNIRLQKICYDIQKLTEREQKLLAGVEESSLYQDKQLEGRSIKLDVVRNKRKKLEERREALLENRSSVPVTTPYKVITEILGEKNVSTVRSRVYLAKKQLAQKVFRRDK